MLYQQSKETLDCWHERTKNHLYEKQVARGRQGCRQPGGWSSSSCASEREDGRDPAAAGGNQRQARGAHLKVAGNASWTRARTASTFRTGWGQHQRGRPWVTLRRGRGAPGRAPDGAAGLIVEHGERPRAGRPRGHLAPCRRRGRGTRRAAAGRSSLLRISSPRTLSAGERTEEAHRRAAQDVPVVAYCRGPFCLMAKDAVELLRRKGYQAFHLTDRVAEWRAADARRRVSERSCSMKTLLVLNDAPTAVNAPTTAHALPALCGQGGPTRSRYSSSATPLQPRTSSRRCPAASQPRGDARLGREPRRRHWRLRHVHGCPGHCGRGPSPGRSPQQPGRTHPVDCLGRQGPGVPDPGDDHVLPPTPGCQRHAVRTSSAAPACRRLSRSTSSQGTKTGSTPRPRKPACASSHVIDTHVHADHYSGGPALARRVGAPYHLHESNQGR